MEKMVKWDQYYKLIYIYEVLNRFYTTHLYYWSWNVALYDTMLCVGTKYVFERDTWCESKCDRFGQMYQIWNYWSTILM